MGPMSSYRDGHNKRVGGKGHQRLKQLYMRGGALQPLHARKETERVYKTGSENTGYILKWRCIKVRRSRRTGRPPTECHDTRCCTTQFDLLV